jgi:uncharacterized protein YeaO (DUF488 family)
VIEIRRIYEQATAEDGYRVLVDRLWPRGISKDKAKIDAARRLGGAVREAGERTD